MALWYWASEISTRTSWNPSWSWIHHTWFVDLIDFFLITDGSISFLALPRPLYKQTIYIRNLAIIISVLGFAFVCFVIGLTLCCSKSRKSGQYKTKEDKGADQAIDADAAIIKGDPRHPDLMEGKEWFL